MKAIPVSRARQHLTEIVDQAVNCGHRSIISRKGKHVAAVVSIEDLEWLRRLEDRKDIKDSRAALKEAKLKGTIGWGKLKAGLLGGTDS